MDGNQFALWLHGWAEIQGDGTPPNAAQWRVILDHLDLAFDKVTPDRSLTFTTTTAGTYASQEGVLGVYRSPNLPWTDHGAITC